MTPELENLFSLLRDEDLQTALEAAEAIAFCGDESVVPRLFAELEFSLNEIERQKQATALDAREQRRPFALEQAIVSLLPLDKCQRELEAGRLSIKWLVRRRRETDTLEEFWGPL